MPNKKQPPKLSRTQAFSWPWIGYTNHELALVQDKKILPQVLVWEAYREERRSPNTLFPKILVSAFTFSPLATYLVLYLSEICFRFHGHSAGLYAQRHFTVHSSVNSDAINNSCFRMRLPALLKPLYFSLQLGSGTFLIIRCRFLCC